jgi:hypothetical protein
LKNQGRTSNKVNERSKMSYQEDHGKRTIME